MQSALAQSVDSLQSSISTKLTSVQSRLNHKIDSLNQLPNPDKLLLKSLDSISGKIDSLKNNALLQDATNATGKITQAPKELTDKLNAIEGKVNQKLGLFSANASNTPSNINLPGADKIALPGNPISSQLPNGLPNELTNKIPDTNLDLSTGPLINAPKEKLSELKKLDAIKNAQGHISEISKVSAGVSGYANDAKALASGDTQAIDQASKNIETKLAGIDEVQQLQKDVTPVQDYTKMIEKWNSDPDYTKELALTKAKDVAVNHFEGHEQELKAAMEKMNGVKEKYNLQ